MGSGMTGGSANRPKLVSGVAALFLTCAGSSLSAQEIPYEFPVFDRIVAIGDIHGAYDTFLETLRATGLVDEGLQWAGGTTHLVQTGDIVARGPASPEAMDLLMALEPQAEAAGGKVHALIGNHEFWLAVGHLEFASEAERERADDYRAGGRYGEWIRGHNAVVKIGDYVFVHGGITPPGADIGLGAVNERVREEMDVENWQNGFAASEDGPLFTRRYSADELVPEDVWEVGEELRQVLEAVGGRAMVMGHTVTYGVIEPRFDGRAILIDAGMLDLYMGGRPAALVIEGDERTGVYAKGTVPIPDSLEGEEGWRYVEAVIAASEDGPAMTHWTAVADCRQGRLAEGARRHESLGLLEDFRGPFAWRREAAECFASVDAEKSEALYRLYLDGLYARAESTKSFDHWDRFARECLRLGRQLDEAFAVAGDLASAQPRSGEAKLTLAWAYLERGDSRRALQVLRAAERLLTSGSDDAGADAGPDRDRDPDPDLFELFVLRGRAQEARGDEEEALESFQQAQRLRAGHPEVQEALARLGSEK